MAAVKEKRRRIEISEEGKEQKKRRKEEGKGKRLDEAGRHGENVLIQAVVVVGRQWQTHALACHAFFCEAGLGWQHRHCHVKNNHHQHLSPLDFILC